VSAPAAPIGRHKWIDDGDGSCEVCGAEGGGSDAGREEDDE
jgi:hypothetical protein